ncbi:hypothetical protein P3T39_005735 [Kitasatospora sp. GP82]|nr:hypothetical protein [Kitasatospora sp. GP82]
MPHRPNSRTALRLCPRPPPAKPGQEHADAGAEPREPARPIRGVRVTAARSASAPCPARTPWPSPSARRSSRPCRHPALDPSPSAYERPAGALNDTVALSHRQDVQHPSGIPKPVSRRPVAAAWSIGVHPRGIRSCRRTRPAGVPHDHSSSACSSVTPLEVPNRKRKSMCWWAGSPLASLAGMGCTSMCRGWSRSGTTCSGRMPVSSTSSLRAALISRTTEQFQQRHVRPMPDDNVWMIQRSAERDALVRLLDAMRGSADRACQGAGSPISRPGTFGCHSEDLGG